MLSNPFDFINIAEHAINKIDVWLEIISFTLTKRKKNLLRSQPIVLPKKEGILNAEYLNTHAT